MGGNSVSPERPVKEIYEASLRLKILAPAHAQVFLVQLTVYRPKFS